MPIQNERTLGQIAFDIKLRDFVEVAEGRKPLAYFDTRKTGLPTIGIGFNLRDGDVRKNVYDALGISEATRIAITTAINSATNNPTINALPTPAARDAELQRLLQVAFGGSAFEMSDAKMNNVFNTEAQKRITPVQTATGLGLSDELVALVSVQYSFGHIPSNVVTALAITDSNEARAETWYQIRYGLNGGANPLPGVANRRYREADMFGLYDGSGIVDEAQAKKIIAMYTAHRTTIKPYEQKYDPTNINAHSATIFDRIKSADLDLIQTYAHGIAIEEGKGRVLVGTDKGDSIAGDEYPNLILGEDGNDILEGKGGADILIGGKGNDQLYGGEGSDTYIYNNGDGRDTIIDDGASDHLKLGSNNFKSLAADKYKLGTGKDAGKQVWEDTGAGLKYVLDSNKNLVISGSALGFGDDGNITIEDYKSGDFEINLTQDIKDEIVAGRSNTTNVFTELNHQVAQNASTSLAENLAKTFTVFLSNPAKAADILKLDLTGGSIAKILGTKGDDTQSFGDGPIEFQLTEGQTEVVFNIESKGDIDANETFDLKATWNTKNETSGTVEGVVLKTNLIKTPKPNKYALFQTSMPQTPRRIAILGDWQHRETEERKWNEAAANQADWSNAA